jgi:HTH-type transcriptional regulator/antitoxin HigA
MNINPIRTDEDYRDALREVSVLIDLDPEPGTEEGDRLEVLATLVEVYESRRFPIDASDPIEAIKFRMEQSGLTPKDLVPSIGATNRVYEILSGKRQLSIAMIRNLHRNHGIPLESLIGG